MNSTYNQLVKNLEYLNQLIAKKDLTTFQKNVLIYMQSVSNGYKKVLKKDLTNSFRNALIKEQQGLGGWLKREF